MHYIRKKGLDSLALRQCRRRWFWAIFYWRLHQIYLAEIAAIYSCWICPSALISRTKVYIIYHRVRVVKGWCTLIYLDAIRSVPTLLFYWLIANLIAWLFHRKKQRSHDQSIDQVRSYALACLDVCILVSWVYWLIIWPIGQLIDWLIDGMIDLLINWLADQLITCLVG